VKFAVAADYVFDGATLRRDRAVEGLDTHLPSGAWLRRVLSTRRSMAAAMCC
jgi:hypothetical protein